MSAPEKLREAVEAIDAEGLSQDRLRALTEALVAVRRVTPHGELAALLRRCSFQTKVFTSPPDGRREAGHVTPTTEARDRIGKFMLDEFEGTPGVSGRAIADFFNICQKSFRRTVDSRRSARPKSLSVELERARPGAAVQKKSVPTEIRHTVSTTAAPNIDGALSMTLKAIGESGDLRKYGGLVREIGKVLV